MKAKNNQITGISFIRKTDDVDKKTCHELILHLEGKIPQMGYGCKEIIDMLNRYHNKYYK